MTPPKEPEEGFVLPGGAWPEKSPCTSGCFLPPEHQGRKHWHAVDKDGERIRCAFFEYPGHKLTLLDAEFGVVHHGTAASKKLWEVVRHEDGTFSVVDNGARQATT